jgi:hypothetical protein
MFEGLFRGSLGNIGVESADLSGVEKTGFG